VRRLALALVALALAGCESTQEKSAKLKTKAKHLALATTGLQITKTSTQVAVVEAVPISGSEGSAVAVTLRNRSSRALREVPIAVTVTDASGRTLYANDAPGLESALISVPSIAPHQTLTWVDDQIPDGGSPARASARVGEAPTFTSSMPRLSVSGVQRTEDPTNGSGASATVTNSSAITQRNLVAYAVARRRGRIVAVGRALLPEVPAGGSAPLQVYFVGEANGATLELTPSPTTFE
jgi:hypothetical protein